MTGHGRPDALLHCMLLGMLWLLAFAPAAEADLVWEDHFTDEQSIVDGASVTVPNGTTVTFDRTVFSDNTGGTFDLDPYRNSDYLTFEQGQSGAHSGYLEFSMDNDNDDPDDFIELALNFDQAVTGLEFSMLDIDSGSWDDGIEVFYNGTNNVRDNSSILAGTGSAVGTDNESYMHGWEGLGSRASSGQTTGNIDFDFGSLQITSITIRYFSTDDASSNPGGQIAGLSDLTFNPAVPEASSLACTGLFGGLALISLMRRRRSRSAAGEFSRSVDPEPRCRACQSTDGPLRVVAPVSRMIRYSARRSDRPVPSEAA